MSKIYHGSLEVVRSPEIRQPNRSLDYGMGLYATTSHEQAERLVRRRMDDNKVSAGHVSIYELDDDAIKRLDTLIFKKPDEEWVNFVMKNRTERGFTHDHDIV